MGDDDERKDLSDSVICGLKRDQIGLATAPPRQDDRLTEQATIAAKVTTERTSPGTRAKQRFEPMWALPFEQHTGRRQLQATNQSLTHDRLTPTHKVKKPFCKTGGIHTRPEFASEQPLKRQHSLTRGLGCLFGDDGRAPGANWPHPVADVHPRPLTWFRYLHTQFACHAEKLPLARIAEGGRHERAG